MRCALLLGVILMSGSAFAQSNVTWQYTAPPECPSEQEFRDWVSARLLGESRAGELAPTAGKGGALHVEVRLEPTEHRALLVIEEPGAPLVERTIEGDTCAELASGLALITALAFAGPKAGTDLSASPPASAGEPDPHLPRSSQPDATRLAPPTNPASSEPPTEPAPDKRPRVSSLRPIHLEIGAAGWLNTWSAPKGMFGANAFARLSPNASRGWSARVAGSYGYRAAAVNERRAEFTFIGVRPEACPISRELPLKLVAEGCGALDLGALRGRGEASSGLQDTASHTIFWAAAVLTGRLRARLDGRFSIEAQAELGLPLVRHEFVFEDPPESIFEVPGVGFGAGLGFGVEFL